MDTERIDGADAFTIASRKVVDYLNRHTPLSDWSISRVAGGEQVHVHVHDEGLIEVGLRVPWDDSFCHQMVQGKGHVIPDSALNPDFACLPPAELVRAYVGFPIHDDGGELFGILCGADQRPMDDPSAVDAELIELFSELLSAHLAAARTADLGRHEAELATALANVDALTGLVNRRGWDSLVRDAQERIDAFGDPVAIAVIDLDGLKQLNDTQGHEAGDELLRRAGNTLREVADDADQVDHVARYGGDEFTILTNDVPVAKLPEHYERFTRALSEVGVRASLGHAYTGPGERTVAEAFRQADAAMYAAKRSRRAS